MKRYWSILLVLVVVAMAGIYTGVLAEAVWQKDVYADYPRLPPKFLPTRNQKAEKPA